MALMEGRKSTGFQDFVGITATNDLKISIVNDDRELYGKTTATRPAYTAVPVGTVFVVVADPLVIYMNDGTAWVEV